MATAWGRHITLAVSLCSRTPVHRDWMQIMKCGQQNCQNTTLALHGGCCSCSHTISKWEVDGGQGCKPQWMSYLSESHQPVQTVETVVETEGWLYKFSSVQCWVLWLWVPSNPFKLCPKLLGNWINFVENSSCEIICVISVPSSSQFCPNSVGKECAYFRRRNRIIIIITI